MIGPNELIPPRDFVHPERSPSGKQVNWSIEVGCGADGVQIPEAEAEHFRVLHLHGHDAHGRFLTSAKPGHFAVLVSLLFQFSPRLSQQDQESLRKEGVGSLRIALGTLRDKKQFFTGRIKEDTFNSVSMTEDSLPHKLLSDYWYDVIRIPMGNPVVDVLSDIVLSVEGHHGLETDLGLILQWSGVPAFQNQEEAVVKMKVIRVR